MGVKERRERQKESLRQEILDAARDLFVSVGYENVTMRKVAEKIEYSPTTIYLHFQDKADLMHSICEETFERLSRKLEQILKSPGDPVERLKRGLRAYVEFGLQNPQHYRVTFMTPHEVNPECVLAPDSAGLKAFSILQQGVADCIQAGKFRNVDVQSASQALWAAVHGLTSLLIAHASFPWVPRDKLTNLITDSMIAGLAA
jgi:AcrR family transcriptional regulator